MSTEFKDRNFKSNELSKCPFTGAGTSAKFSAGRGQTNRDFWPNSLNLKILSQHSNLTNPMDKKFNYSKEFKKYNLRNNMYFNFLKSKLKKDIMVKEKKKLAQCDWCDEEGNSVHCLTLCKKVKNIWNYIIDII